jgi:hypothetical protein
MFRHSRVKKHYCHFWQTRLTGEGVIISGAMTKEQRNSIIKLVRNYLKLGIDVRVLKAILISEQSNQRVTPDWEASLLQLRDSPEYKQVVEDNELLIARIEQAMTDDDLIELLLQTPPKGPVN